MKCYTINYKEEIKEGITLFPEGDWHVTRDHSVRTCRNDPPALYFRDTPPSLDTVLYADIVRLRVDDTVYHVLRRGRTDQGGAILQVGYWTNLIEAKYRPIAAIRGGYIRASEESSNSPIITIMPDTVLSVEHKPYIVYTAEGTLFLCDRTGVNYYLDSLKSASVDPAP